jgi:hypothetical protein
LRARLRAVGRAGGGSPIVSSVCFVFGLLRFAISLFATVAAILVFIGLGHHCRATQKRSRQCGGENEFHRISPIV